MNNHPLATIAQAWAQLGHDPELGRLSEEVMHATGMRDNAWMRCRRCGDTMSLCLMDGSLLPYPLGWERLPFPCEGERKEEE